MALLLFAVIGFLVGYRLEMSRLGYVTMALTAVATAIGQILLLFTTQDREAMTLLPLLGGALLVLFMLMGAITRRAIRARKKA